MTDDKNPEESGRTGSEKKCHVGGSNNPPADCILKEEQAKKLPFLDWLSFTIKDYTENDIHFWIDFLGGETRKREKGYLNYSIAIDTNFFSLICYSNINKEIGLYISLPARALKILSDKIDSQNLIKLIIAGKGKFTRVDLTIDDFENNINIDDLIEKIKKGEINSKLKSFSVQSGRVTESFHFIESGRIGTSETGKTLYIGNSKKSNAFLRIYDKGFKEKTDFSWKRIELVLRHENADQFLNNHINIDPETGETRRDGKKTVKLKEFEIANIPELINYYFQPLEITYKKNGLPKIKKYWNIDENWTKAITTEYKNSIGLPKYEKGLEDLLEWTVKHLSGLDTMLTKIYGTEYTERKIDEGEKSIDKNKRYQFYIENAAYKKRD